VALEFPEPLPDLIVDCAIVGKSTKGCKLVGTCRCAVRRHLGLLIPLGEAPKPVEVSELSESSPQCIERTHSENTMRNGWPAPDSRRQVADLVNV
jgi:hypothetical protein